MKLVISKSGQSSNPFLNRIKLVQGDITAQGVDAIAILIPQTLGFRGSINSSVMDACGHNLDEFILEHIYKPKLGDVYAIPAFQLPVKHIFVGIMPHYRTEFDMNDSHLSGVIRKIMELSRCMLLESVAFPPLASGKGGYPKAKAARLIAQGISERMEESFKEVRIICSDREMLRHFDDKLRVLGWEG